MKELELISRQLGITKIAERGPGVFAIVIGVIIAGLTLSWIVASLAEIAFSRRRRLVQKSLSFPASPPSSNGGSGPHSS